MSVALLPHLLLPLPRSEAPRACRGGGRAQIAMAAKAKSSFTPYTIQGPASDVFPLPQNRQAIHVHKKHKGSGCVASKAPIENVPQLLQGKLDSPGLRILHLDPPVFSIDDFFTPHECDAFRALSDDSTKAFKLEQSATFSAQTASGRTSTTWFVRYQDAPELVARASALFGKPVEHFEEPQEPLSPPRHCSLPTPFSPGACLISNVPSRLLRLHSSCGISQASGSRGTTTLSLPRCFPTEGSGSRHCWYT